MLQTNAALSAEEAALAYRDLWKVERAFRSLKTTLELRPVYHWKEKRIYGHIVLCFLALVMQCQFQKLMRESAPESAPGEYVGQVGHTGAARLDSCVGEIGHLRR
jgi:transposase